MQPPISPHTPTPPTNLTPSWLTTFEPFTLHHLIVVTICAVVVAVWITLSARLRTAHPNREHQLRIAVALLIAGVMLTANIWYLWPTRFDPRISLPFHVCDLLFMIAPLMLITQHPILRSLIYFGGLGLTTQGFFTPVLNSGPTDPHYWWFWFSHTAIVGSALYDLIVLRFRPTFRHYADAILLGLAYVLAIVMFNLPLGLNYGYLGMSTPDAATILDHLGPWHTRVVLLPAIVIIIFTMLWLPWAFANKDNPAQPAHTH